MNQDTRPAPFNLGDHVRYVGARRQVVPAGQANAAEVVLAPGMEGVILQSTGALSDRGAAAPEPWRCRVQFHNGFQYDITPENVADFETARGAGAATDPVRR